MVMTGKSVIHIADVESEMGFSKERAILTISRLKKKGWLQKLKAGLYLMVPFGSDTSDPIPENAMEIAMEVFSPGYVGGWTAAEYWDLTEQIFNTTVFYTSMVLRKSDHAIAGLSFKTKFVRAEDVFGTVKEWERNTPIEISDLHRTLIDILDNPALGGGARMMVDISRAYWKKPEASFDKVYDYVLRLNHGAVFKRLGLIAEKVFHIPKKELKKIEEKCKSGIILLDPNGSDIGPIITRWGLRINIPTEDLL
jgi:predicted transcriptional regulator of viral defense system